MRSDHPEAVHWAPVAASWCGHRAEPLIHERVWACPLVFERGTDTGHEAGFDADGRPVSLRPLDEEWPADTVTYGAREIVVTQEGDEIRTELDAAGRPVRTTYSEAQEERYHYDADGRLVAIDESDDLWYSARGTSLESGGRSVVEHDSDGPLRIVNESLGEVWSRCTVPWATTLAAGAEQLRRDVVEALQRALASAGAAADTEVFHLQVVYVDQGMAPPCVNLGLQAERSTSQLRLWYPEAGPEALKVIEADSFDQAAAELLLREAAMKQPYDPYRAVYIPVGRLLAAHDWSGILTPTEDFIVTICEHDEGLEEKFDAARAINPPARLAHWTLAEDRADPYFDDPDLLPDLDPVARIEEMYDDGPEGFVATGEFWIDTAFDGSRHHDPPDEVHQLRPLVEWARSKTDFVEVRYETTSGQQGFNAGRLPVPGDDLPPLPPEAFTLGRRPAAD